MRLSLTLAQINPIAGDLSGNTAQILEAAQRCHLRGCELMVTPELALCGYDAQDLYGRDDFLQACEQALAQLQKDLRAFAGLTVIVGHPERISRSPSDADLEDCVQLPKTGNCASVLHNGQCLARYRKPSLPSYPVYDQGPYGYVNSQVCVLPLGAAQVPVGIVVCEDLRVADTPAAPLARNLAAGARCIISLGASPWHQGKTQARERRLSQLASKHAVPIAYAHSVGAQDALLFDGNSFVVDSQGQVIARAAAFASDVLDITLHFATGPATVAAKAASNALPSAPCNRAQTATHGDAALAELWQALVLGLHDYVVKNRFPGVLLGLSGGVDSALVLALAVDALGPERVHAVLLPSPYTAIMSLEDARTLATQLQVQHDTLPITPAMATLNKSLAPLFADKVSDVTAENLQARIRGLLLMALSNKQGHLLLTTGNKSEIACGYATLYGDMCGGFAPLCDVYKTTVFALARWRNRFDPWARGQAPIPERIITRPPSAELRPQQTDQDSLPDYAVLDAILLGLIEHGLSPTDLIAQGFASATVKQVLQLLKRSEYKRQQAAPGTRVSPCSLGRDWHYPLTNGYDYGV